VVMGWGGGGFHWQGMRDLLIIQIPGQSVRTCTVVRAVLAGGWGGAGGGGFWHGTAYVSNML
jgi:hypothetical protein